MREQDSELRGGDSRRPLADCTFVFWKEMWLGVWDGIRNDPSKLGMRTAQRTAVSVWASMVLTAIILENGQPPEEIPYERA
jgi:hypothetical protein